MIQQNKRPVTVEDLLRLKRCEQPTLEFWAEFDSTLRAKQLAALVEKRPWWQRLPRVALASWRYSLPIGGAAALAITFFSVRDSAPTNLTGVQISATVASAVTPSMTELTVTTVAIAPQALALVAEEAHTPATVAVVADHVESAPMVTAPAADHAVVAAAEEVGASSSLAGVLGLDVAKSADLKSSSNILVATQTSDLSLLGGLLGGAVVTEPVSAPTMVASVRTRTDPLLQMTVPSRSRRSAQAIAAVASYLPEGPAEEVIQGQANRLSKDRVYESPKSRVWGKGDRFGVGM